MDLETQGEWAEGWGAPSSGGAGGPLSLSILPLPVPLLPSPRHSWADALSTIRLPHVKYICPHA